MQVVQVSGVTAGKLLTIGDIDARKMDRGWVQVASGFGVVL